MSAAVIWHDLECGSYELDLPLWRELADAAGGPVLDVGAGTGRVALDLARRGHDVVALDREPALLDALRERAAGVPVETACADARAFDLARTFALVIVPMQTIQLMDGPAERARVLACVRSHTAHGGRVALAIADPLDGAGPEFFEPLPDIRELDGVVYASRPVRLSHEGPWLVIERVREIVGRDGAHAASDDVVRLARLEAAELEQEAREAGFGVAERRAIPGSEEYTGSTVVMLGG
jgi:SAM-dependent methyltransferase